MQNLDASQHLYCATHVALLDRWSTATRKRRIYEPRNVLPPFRCTRKDDEYGIMLDVMCVVSRNVHADNGSFMPLLAHKSAPYCPLSFLCRLGSGA
jgi:hypothetical protein